MRHSATRSSRGGTIGSTRRAPDEAKASLLAAADRLFYGHGVHATSVDAIADAAGVTKRTLYYHFPTKEALVAAYLDARDRAMWFAIVTTVGRLALPGDRILAIFDHFEMLSSMPDYRGCPFNSAVGERAGSNAAKIAHRHKTEVMRWFSHQVELAGGPSPKQLSAQLLVLVDGALNGALVFDSVDSARAARDVAQLLLSANGVKISKGAKAKETRNQIGARGRGKE